MSEKTGVIVISSSDILCGGLMTVLARTEFAVDECLPSVPADTGAGLILVDPTVPGYSAVFSFDVPVVAVIHAVYDEESLSQFAAVLNIYDTRQAIIRKLRKVVSPSNGTSPIADGSELSPREKEILVCVAIQIQYFDLHRDDPPQEHHGKDRYQIGSRSHGIRDTPGPHRHRIHQINQL